MIKIAIVEDEAVFQSKIQRYLLRYQEHNEQSFQFSVFGSGSEFLLDYRPGYDIIFMDIQMPGIDGMETARAIRKLDRQVAIAFVTNVASYALQSYEVEAIDFIVKPFTYEVFEFKLGRILSRTERSRSEAAVMLSSGDSLQKVIVAELRYVEVTHHTLVYHLEKDTVSVRGSMREAEELLALYSFSKCGQSYLVNLQHVTRIEADEVFLDDSIRIHISRGSKKNLIRTMSDYMARQ